MWELIRANKRRSLMLFLGMGVVLLLLGLVIGFAFGGTPETAFTGMIVATAVWFIMSLVGHFQGSSILLASSNAVEVDKKVHPQLFNIVEEMTMAAGLRKMPKVYLIRSNALNAFATGRNADNSAIAVTAGLLALANRDELQGVVAHEMAHIINRDIRFMTLAGIMLGSIVLISQMFSRSLLYSSGRFSGGSSKNSGGGQILIIAAAILFAILAPIAAQLLYFAISRKREYLADATAVRLTRYPEGLASALEKISRSSADLESANKVTAPMYIANPLKKEGQRVRNLSSTHPPIEERVRILRKLSGASYVDYQQTFQEVIKKGGTLLPGSALTNTEAVPFRGRGEALIMAATAAMTTSTKQTQTTPQNVPPTAKAAQTADAPLPPDAKPAQVAHASGDIIRAANGFRFVNCSCGMKYKIPPGFKSKALRCTKCGTVHNL
jgi:heat shock protein HtpX